LGINEKLITYTTFQTIQKKHFPLITKSKLVSCFRCWRHKKARTERSYRKVLPV